MFNATKLCMPRLSVLRRNLSTSTIDLSNKVAIITGAESGIGRSIATQFSQHGARVVAVGLNTDGLLSLQHKINCDIFTANCADEPSVEHYTKVTFDKYNAIDILCNIAGGCVGKETTKPFHLKSMDIIRDCIDNNFWSTAINCHKTIPWMLQTMQKRKWNNMACNGCSIINMASQLTEISIAGYSDYNASKHGIIGLSKALCADYGASNIRCNTIHPGPTDTPSLNGQDKKALADQMPIGRIAKPEEVAKLFLWLASDHSLFINGSKFVIDGGFTNQCSFFPSFVHSFVDPPL